MEKYLVGNNMLRDALNKSKKTILKENPDRNIRYEGFYLSMDERNLYMEVFFKDLDSEERIFHKQVVRINI